MNLAQLKEQRRFETMRSELAARLAVRAIGHRDPALAADLARKIDEGLCWIADRDLQAINAAIGSGPAAERRLDCR